MQEGHNSCLSSLPPLHSQIYNIFTEIVICPLTALLPGAPTVAPRFCFLPHPVPGGAESAEVAKTKLLPEVPHPQKLFHKQWNC